MDAFASGASVVFSVVALVVSGEAVTLRWTRLFLAQVWLLL